MDKMPESYSDTGTLTVDTTEHEILGVRMGEAAAKTAERIAESAIKAVLTETVLVHGFHRKLSRKG